MAANSAGETPALPGGVNAYHEVCSINRQVSDMPSDHRNPIYIDEDVVHLLRNHPGYDEAS